MKLIILILLLTTFLQVKSQGSYSLDQLDSLLNDELYSQVITASKRNSKLENIYQKMRFNGILTSAYLGLNQTGKAKWYANKVFRVPNIIAGRYRTRKTLVCSTIANYYINNEKWKQAVKWKKKRLYKYRWVFCGTGQFHRNITKYENIIELYYKLDNVRLTSKYENKLEKYKNSKKSQFKLY